MLDAEGRLRIPVARVFKPLLPHRRYKGASGGRSAAKCLAKGTRVLLADGSVISNEDVIVGDFLMGLDSQPREVLNIERGTAPLFSIKQMGAEDFEATGNHLLVLQRSRHAREDVGEISRYGRPQRPNGRYASYEDDDQRSLITVEEFQTKSKRFKAHFFGYKVPLLFPHQPVLVDPYLFGLWLGDGDSGRLAITTADPEIEEYINRYVETMFLHVRRFQKPNNKAAHFLISTGVQGSRQAPIHDLLELGVLNNKHIPEEYIINDDDTRLRVLAGLVDSDGHVRNGYVTIVQKSERLAQDIKRLADSLGFRTNLRTASTSCNGKSFICWKLSIGGDVNRIPCLVTRKRDGLSAHEAKDWRRWYVDVSPSGDGEYIGFEVSDDRLFLLADGTVTHNSHFFAAQIIRKCATGHHRVACLREYQSSMKESSYQILKDKIRYHGVEHLFRPTETEIRGPFDSLIVFKGLQGTSAFSLKSLEGFDTAWTEEAQSISQASLDIMTPTFRTTPGMTSPPEMMFSWNSIDVEDPVEKLFRSGGYPHPCEIANSEAQVHPKAVVLKDGEVLPLDDDFVRVHATYHDNPWFPADSRADMLRSKMRDAEKYAHVWLGEYRRRSEAAVFKNWRAEAFDTAALVAQHQVRRFYYGADWGFAQDPSVLVRCFIVGRTLYVDWEVSAVGSPFSVTPEEEAAGLAPIHVLFDRVPGAKKWPIRADSARPETIDHMKRHGFNISPAVKGPGSIEDGVEYLQSYDIVVHPRCKLVVDEMAKYSWKVDKRTEEVLPVLADKDNHCIAEGTLVHCSRGLVPIEDVVVGDRVLTRVGYKRVIAGWLAGYDRETILVCSGKASVRVTPDHEIWSVTKSFARADALSYDDEILTVEPRLCLSGLIGFVSTVITTAATVTTLITHVLSAVKRTIYTVMFGLIIKVRSLMGITSIINSVILKITTSPTLNVYPYLTTAPSILGAMSGELNKQSCSTVSGHSPKSGTPAKRAIRSTSRSAGWLTRALSQSQNHASNVVGNFSPVRSGARTGFARMLASLTTAVRLVSMMRNEFARFAEKISRSINTRKWRLVHGPVRILSDGVRAKVYDLTVEDQHEFFAGGILVSNCIDSLRYALEGERLAPALPPISPDVLARAHFMRRGVAPPRRPEPGELPPAVDDVYPGTVNRGKPVITPAILARARSLRYARR